jgi:hypothetical protein
MTLSNMTASQLDGHEPQRVNNALLHFNLAGLTYGLATTSIVTGAPNDSYLVLSTQNFPLPRRSIGRITHGFLNEKRNWAGNPNYDPITVQYKDMVDVDTAGQLYWWFTCVHNPSTGATLPKSSYAVSGFAIQYPPDGITTGTADPSGLPARQWNLIGCWLDDFQPGNVDMDGEGMQMVSCTIVIDKVLPGTYSGGTYY